MNIVLGITTLGLYSLATGLITIGRNKATTTQNSIAFFICVFSGLVSHYLLSVDTAYVQHSFNFSVASMTFWVSALVVSLFLLGTLLYPIKNLGIVVLPVSILCILFAFLWGDKVTLIEQQSALFYWHISISVTGFTLLTLSVLQATLFAAQENSLRTHKQNFIVHMLPPLQTMEKVLFRILWLGFTALTIAIILGAFYNNQSTGSWFSLTHHSLLAAMGWLVFAVLLYGRVNYGWRGIQVVRWNLAGFVLLGLGYFGSKIVTELIA